MQPGERVDFVDTLVQGLVLRIGRSRRAWRFHYRHQGERKLLALGFYPEVGLAGARELAKDARIKLAAGIDPAAPARAAAVTVKDLIDSYIRLHASTKRTASKIERRLRKNVEAVSHSYSIADGRSPIAGRHIDHNHHGEHAGRERQQVGHCSALLQVECGRISTT